MKRRKWILIGVFAALAFVAAFPVYVFCDLYYHGPQVVRFNEHCARVVRDEGLMGASRDAVEEALGEPTSVYTYSGSGNFSLNYAPHPPLPLAQFQAHFKDGKLVSVELYDD